MPYDYTDQALKGQQTQKGTLFTPELKMILYSKAYSIIVPLFFS